MFGGRIRMSSCGTFQRSRIRATVLLSREERPCFGWCAIGDVRSGSVKRVGGAIGEGAAAVALIHQHLAADGAVPTLKGERPVGDVS